MLTQPLAPADFDLIEETLQRLKPPTWPEDLFGTIDKPLAAQGRALFAENCAGWPAMRCSPVLPPPLFCI